MELKNILIVNRVVIQNFLLQRKSVSPQFDKTVVVYNFN